MSMISEMRDNLNSEWRILQSQWADTRQQWKDAVAERFEHEFWEDWENEVPDVLRSMSDLDEILEQALLNTENER